jgi:hypothetical protein
VRDLIVSLKHASRSIILCTHDLDEAERLADQVAIMRRGQIAAYGTPAALRAQASPETTVHITLAAPCPVARAATRAIPSVLGLDGASDGAARDDTQLVYRTSDPATVNPQVVAQLVALGASIITVTSTTRSLEDVYADAMGSAPRASGAGEPEPPLARAEVAAGVHPYAPTDGRGEVAAGMPRDATILAPQPLPDADHHAEGDDSARSEVIATTWPANGNGNHARMPGTTGTTVAPGAGALAVPKQPDGTAGAARADGTASATAAAPADHSGK